MSKNVVMWVSMLAIAAVVVGVLVFQQLGQRVQSLSLQEVFASGKRQRCTFVQTSSSAVASGTVFTTPENLRGDFMVTGNGQTVYSHMISDGRESLIWGDENPNGYTITAQDTDGGSVLGPDIKGEFRCLPWFPRPSRFVPPADVMFNPVATPASPTSSVSPLPAPRPTGSPAV